VSAEEIYFWWFVWLAIATVIVIAAAALLIAVIVAARRILRLAKTALVVVGEIEQNTKSIWQLNASRKVAGDLLSGAEAIRDNGNKIVEALSKSTEKRVA